MQLKTLKRAGLVASIVGALMASAAPSDAMSISKTRFVDDRDLYATVDGKEKLIDQGVTGAWIIEERVHQIRRVHAIDGRTDFSG